VVSRQVGVVTNEPRIPKLGKKVSAVPKVHVGWLPVALLRQRCFRRKKERLAEYQSIEPSIQDLNPFVCQSLHYT